MFSPTSVTTVVATKSPPQSPGRKPSIFDAMFDNFKFGGKKDEEDEHHSRSGDGVMDEKMTPADKGNLKVHYQHQVTGPFSINETKPIEEPKGRSLSVAFADVFRRPSETSNKSRNSSPNRKTSTSSSGGRKMSIFGSHNPDPDNDVPRNASIHSHHSGSNNESADLARKGSYVPRNATASFLKSASGLTPDERAKKLEEVNEAKRNQSVSSPPASRTASISAAAANRKASLALSDTSDSSHTSGRRPSGMIPGNIAARYMRTASYTDEEREQTGSRRRPSRQASSGDGTVKAVALGPEQYQQWQNSVSKSRVGNNYQKPGETGGAHRMQSLAGIADIAESGETPDDDARRGRSTSTAPIVAITPASPHGTVRPKKSFTIDTTRANNAPSSGSKVDSAYLADQISPKGSTFGNKIGATSGTSMVGRTGGPTSPAENEALESLGFRGAVPA
ncbi:hypothetical protein CAC42_7992 [Sphaceloma murrayae]|uniref:Uncharacterized protein n=1 Tax=Sphaceloma murrayae TaxID=2082308 RepID=A0A2K1QL36_9PEZI|nr:hypothetical protein CAC42_7992 [Sphaceloma murrayae]